MQSGRKGRCMFSGRTWRALPGLLAVALLLLSGCSALAPKPQPLDLVLLHTNDMLGFTKPAT
jgi:hypothetical protein